MEGKMYSDRIPALIREWILCPYCGAKHSIHTDKAECHGVLVKCTRGCGREFEIIIRKGRQEK